MALSGTQSGTQWHSEWHSEWHSVALRVALRVALSGTQWHSDAIICNHMQSVAISGTSGERRPVLRVRMDHDGED